MAKQSFVNSVVALARQQLGVPYSWGGGGSTGPSRGIGRGAQTVGFDCSGLLQYLWAQEGIGIPRDTYGQYTAGVPVAEQNLQPGDAVFFEPSPKGPAHTGIYIGNGQFIEEPHTGASARVSTLASRSDYVGARRYATATPSGAYAPLGRGTSGTGQAGGGPITTAQRIDAFLQGQNSPLAGLGQQFVTAGQKYGVDPALLVAISGGESSYGTYKPIQGIHNPFGYGPNRAFPSWGAAINTVASDLGRNYISQGLNTIGEIQKKWAPVGASNDPTGLNQNWINNVSGAYRALTGQAPTSLGFSGSDNWGNAIGQTGINYRPYLVSMPKGTTGTGNLFGNTLNQIMRTNTIAAPPVKLAPVTTAAPNISNANLTPSGDLSFQNLIKNTTFS